MFQELRIEGTNLSVVQKVQYLLHTPEGAQKYWQTDGDNPHYIENGMHITLVEEDLAGRNSADLERDAEENAIGVRGIYRVQGNVIIAKHQIPVVSTEFIKSPYIYFGDRDGVNIYTLNGRSWATNSDIKRMVDACMGINNSVRSSNTDCRAVLVHYGGVLALSSSDYIWSQGELSLISDFRR